MASYYRSALADFVGEEARAIVGRLNIRYAEDGFAQQYLSQTRAWAELVVLLQDEFRKIIHGTPSAGAWSVLLEFPLYRLQRRIDVVLLTNSIIVIEAKVGETRFFSTDERQVEEYCLDLRDFHAGSSGKCLVPILWSTKAPPQEAPHGSLSQDIAPVLRAGTNGLSHLISYASNRTIPTINASEWDESPYRPVPSVIQAATSIFAGHDVRQMTLADASNLGEAANRIGALIEWARKSKNRVLIFLSGVPGSGKTLCGLQVVHDAICSGSENKGDVVYLSGNTPLVTVLREALARSEYSRLRALKATEPLNEIRRTVRARIQHVNDFLKEVLQTGTMQTPHEHAIVFDEAQRAWDESQGEKKFSRPASEPALLLQVMALRCDWCACICLIGGGQEINSGERGVSGWGNAIRGLPVEASRQWTVFGPPDVLSGGLSTNGDSLGELPTGVRATVDPHLQLEVPMRSFRSPALNEWVNSVLSGDSTRAAEIASRMVYPLKLTRSLVSARAWLRRETRGQRRSGLVANSGARRLRADGLGELLHATSKMSIAHWYLNPPGDIRSSYALEVPANEYTAQGLELDFVGVCWGGNFLRELARNRWLCRRLNGANWQVVADPTRRKFIENGYRVLLTRAREGLVIWVPEGDQGDKTREPDLLDATAEYIAFCGAIPLAATEQHPLN